MFIFTYMKKKISIFMKTIKDYIVEKLACNRDDYCFDETGSDADESSSKIKNS